MLYGSARITAIDAEGRRFVDDVGVGDMWYFASVPALDPGPRSGWLRVPARVRRRRVRRGQYLLDERLVQAHAQRRAGQEFRRAGLRRSATRPHPSELLHLSRRQYRDRSTRTRLPARTEVPQSFSHRMMAQEPIRTTSGTVRITDSSSSRRRKRSPPRLSRSTRAACANSTGTPISTSGSTTSRGKPAWACSPPRARRARSIFTPAMSDMCPLPWDTTSRTRARPPCDSWRCSGARYYADLSLDQWMALTPPELVSAHLKLDAKLMTALRKKKVPIVPA